MLTKWIAVSLTLGCLPGLSRAQEASQTAANQMVFAAATGDTVKVEQLYEATHNCNVKSPHKFAYSTDKQSLISSDRWKEVEGDKDPEFTTWDLWTPLIAAIITNHHETATYLLASGADVNCTTYHGYSALWLWCVHSDQSDASLQVAELMLRRGARLDAVPQTVLCVDDADRTPLDLAQSMENPKILLLFDKYAKHIDQNEADDAKQ